jgi:hypothetical protein
MYRVYQPCSASSVPTFAMRTETAHALATGHPLAKRNKRTAL